MLINELLLCSIRASAALRNGENIPAYYLFLSGPGGMGKSHVMKMIHRDVNYFFNLYKQTIRDNPLVLLTSYTGTAAFNTEG